MGLLVLELGLALGPALRARWAFELRVVVTAPGCMLGGPLVVLVVEVSVEVGVGPGVVVEGSGVVVVIDSARVVDGGRAGSPVLVEPGLGVVVIKGVTVVV